MKITSLARQWVFSTYTNLAGQNGMVTVPVLTGPNRGKLFRLDLMRHVEPAYFYGTYDKDVLKAALLQKLAGKVVWDCGIYLGFYTVFFASAVGPRGRVIAFEPDPENLQRANENCTRNGLRNVEFRHAAIGAPIGETELSVSSVRTNSHLPGVYIGANRQAYDGDNQVVRSILVKCMSLDQAAADPTLPRPDLVKIDIEGAELMALDHMHALASEIRPVLLLELHNPECDKKAWEFARRYDYQLSSISRGAAVTRLEDVSGTLLCEPR